ncbi:hypothetical protein AMATHDRAFT_87287 [Amanita thiersii Skay4041]|uniref:Zn(2)-C6 fungal-type domain-containing protein n=1 Tax=Amanita thiersii Skay4041 TaxID=703135 RepID=A0A2A9NC18_9AGAR|nr:hypothetical protein AMATHDRAFT_87287 [Amanita thiersii Skay4041]
MSLGTGDHHQSTPPPLFDDMASAQYHISRHLQRTYHSGSYSSENYPSDSHQGVFASNLPNQPPLVPRRHLQPTDNAADLSDHQYLMSTNTGGLYSSTSQHPFDLPQQQQYVAPPQGWPSYEPALGFQPPSTSHHFNPYPSSSPYPPPRLTPPPISNIPGASHQAGGPRMTLAGSLDPSTGIFYRTPEHPRLRTAQACEKCRTRKAKCSGEHPTCKRCQTRGLVCEYAKEGRVRGPNKPKSKAAGSSDDSRNHTSRAKASAGDESRRTPEQPSVPMPVMDALADHDNRTIHGTVPITQSRAGEHHSTRIRPTNLKLDISSTRFPLDNSRSGEEIIQGQEYRQHQDMKNVEGAMTSLSHNDQFRVSEETGTMQGSMHIPTSYQGIHVPTPTGIPLSLQDMNMHIRHYDENRSPSTSSTASLHGHQSSCPTQPLLHPYIQGLVQQQHGDDGHRRFDGASIPVASSPSAHTFSYEPSPSSVTASPSVPPQVMLQFNGHNEVKSSLQLDATSAPLSLDPVWVDLRNKTDFTGIPYDGGRLDGLGALTNHDHHDPIGPILRGNMVTPNGRVHSVSGNSGNDNNAHPHVQGVYPIDLQLH